MSRPCPGTGELKNGHGKEDAKMWVYEKRLQFPVNIKEPNAKMAQFIMSQYGGP